jgi:Xaa-Pro aminopeptidase
MTATKLDRIRKAMLRLHIDVLIVPSTDPHQSEYLPSFWKCREWLTGFTGSAGVVVVTQSQALFWTDSRYFIQAEIELNPPFQLVKQVTRNPEFIDWINTNLDFGKNVGIDGQLVSHVMFEQMLKTFATKQIKVSLTGDLFQQFWESRPLLPDGKIFEHEGALAGESRKQKIEKLITLLNLNKAGYLVISTLDDIAWLLNLRGNDIPFNPVFLSYCVQTPDTTHLFVDFKKIDEAIQEKLNNDGVLIHSYEDIHKFLNKIKPYTNVLVDEANLNQALYSSIPHECKIIDNGSIIAKYKAVKNEVQIKEYRLAQKFDGIAMCNFLHWIENKVSQKPITEVDAAGMMEKFRAAQPGYRGLSFPVYRPMAQMPPYRTIRLVKGQMP